MMKDDSVYLRHILDAFAQIDRYMDGISHEEFFSNNLIQDGVIRQLEVMGEATRNLSEDLRNNYPQIPWRQMIGLRNRMIHAYFNIDLQILWEIIETDLPDLKSEIARILDSISMEREDFRKI